MEIYVDGKRALLKSGDSFEYIAENRLFGGSDGYTLSVTFPLRECPENLAIFGRINRMDVVASKVIFDAEIRERDFTIYGALTITEINETEVKTQFLEGRSAQNFDTTFDDIYIDELDLGQPKMYNSLSDIPPADAWYQGVVDLSYVALPWWGDGCTNFIQNGATYDSNTGVYSWDENCTGLSWQPYLIFIAKQICKAYTVEYDFDFSEWEAHDTFKYLLICNSLPYAWETSAFTKVLPHWTISEFFENLEPLLRGQFDIDHKAKKVTFSFYDNIAKETAPVMLENVVDEYQADITVEDPTCDYLLSKNIVYKDQDYDDWKYLSCSKALKNGKLPYISTVKLDTMEEMIKYFIPYNEYTVIGAHLPNSPSALVYVKEVDAYFMLRVTRVKAIVKRTDNNQNIEVGARAYTYKYKIQPLNLLGGYIVDDSDDAEDQEIELIPVHIDETDDEHGRCMFLSYSSYDEENEDIQTQLKAYDDTNIDEYVVNPVDTEEARRFLKAVDDEENTEYYDTIYFGFWNGICPYVPEGKLPYPVVENVIINDDRSYHVLQFDCRLNSSLHPYLQNAYKVDPQRKSTIKFLSNKIPNPRAVFYIHGKRYICEKLTATFTADAGMSQLIKGTFYPVVDD